MPRYVYTGPAEERGSIPSWGFDDGILAPDQLAALIGRGRVRDLSQVLAEHEAAAPATPEPKPLNRMNKTELQALATELGLSTDGTNSELIERIEGTRG